VINSTNDYLSEKAKNLTPYVAGLQPQEAGWIKLNTNEGPYPPSPKVQEALANTDISKLRLYPDGESTTLREAIAADLNKAYNSRKGGMLSPAEAKDNDNTQTRAASCSSYENTCESINIGPDNIFCGNGSDEVLALAFQAFYSGKENILTPDISYGFYPVWGKMFDVGLKHAPLNEDFSLNPSDYKNANGVIIANPNAPTGQALGLLDVEKLLQQNPKGVVLVDEAYIDFADVESAVSLLPGICKAASTRHREEAPHSRHCEERSDEAIQETKDFRHPWIASASPRKDGGGVNEGYKNLLIVRTFSKSHALAGLRVGYAIGPTHLINALRQVRDAFNSYPLDMLSQTAATAAIKDRPYLEKIVNQVKSTRDSTISQLQNLGYEVTPSHTNFILIKTQYSQDLYNHLLNNKILTRYWPTPKLKNHLRVSIGTNPEMEAFIKCVQEYTSAIQTKQT